MKAVVYTRYGPPDVLHLAEVSKPVPKANEILVKIFATTAAAGDWRLRKADPFLARLFNGLLRPKKVNILGFELSGVVEEVGAEVTRFQPGDEVFAFAGFGFGAYAEYICLRTDGAAAKDGLVAIKPANLSHEEAAAIPCGGLTALGFLKKGEVKRRRKVLIYGASGSVGTYAVQIARHFGADVTGVCSAANMALVRSLGADKVIDYTAEDFSRGDARYDLIFDAVGKLSKRRGKRALATGGLFLSVKSSADIVLEDLIQLKELAESGQIRPVIDKRYRLEEVADAHRYVESWRKRGNVILTVTHGAGA